ncbi:uncharacterized protein EDB93DRAFT_37693 [Suillus bovinus]|uniref:uncharacterized protein n=1 Tax=Suillus bovinus TaxID=48563 RepID=UPI001B880639|nr:uncharacterized protein EDB93DRAFT_37693 [Suillus bovinus]KAG2160073.1 hypothetical protein EDB93DRAFT_37693 [Suillus bovinus]
MDWYGNMTLHNTPFTNMTIDGTPVTAVQNVDNFLCTGVRCWTPSARPGSQPQAASEIFS